MSDVKTIEVDALKKLYDENPDLCLIDVREQSEWDEIRIPDALHIPKGMLLDHIQEVAPKFSKPIYLHCLRGGRSMAAGKALVEKGYQEVYSVNGGIEAWEAADYDVELGDDGHHGGCCC